MKSEGMIVFDIHKLINEWIKTWNRYFVWHADTEEHSEGDPINLSNKIKHMNINAALDGWRRIVKERSLINIPAVELSIDTQEP